VGPEKSIAAPDSSELELSLQSGVTFPALPVTKKPNSEAGSKVF
jgi:hypothetical protein